MSRYCSILTTSALIVVSATPAIADHTKDFTKIITPVIMQKDITIAEKEFLKDSQSDGRNQLLYLYELAGIYHLTGDFAKSAAFFDMADSIAHNYEGKAVASLGGGLSQVGAGLTNDTILSWEGAPFDKVMSRTMNAMNYIAKKDLEGARVEVKKAEEYQSKERKKIEGKVDAASEKDITAPNFSDKYGPMFSFVQNVRNSYENAFTYYLSSQIYRAYGKQGLNDAIVDIKQAYDLAPESPAIQAAYLDLAARNATDGEGTILLNELKTRFAVGTNWVPSDSTMNGTVVVIFEAGFAPMMSEVAIDLQLPKGELFSMAFPIYNDFGSVQPPLQILAGTVNLTTTKVLDIRPLAVKSLKERMPAIVTRGSLGAVAKIAAQKEAEKQFGFFGKIAAKVATKGLTNADLRSWLSIPSEVQAAQFTLATGTTELTLAAYDWTDKVIVDVATGSTTFVIVRGIPGYKTIAAKTFDTPDIRPGSTPQPLATPPIVITAPQPTAQPPVVITVPQPLEQPPAEIISPKPTAQVHVVSPASLVPAPLPIVNTTEPVSVPSPVIAVSNTTNPVVIDSALVERLDSLRQGDLGKALELGQKRIKAIPAHHWTIRLEVANLPATLKSTVEAFKALNPDLFVASIKLRSGKIAYQLFLGEYASKAEAESAAKAVPSIFLEGGEQPIPFLSTRIPTQANCTSLTEAIITLVAVPAPSITTATCAHT